MIREQFLALATLASTVITPVAGAGFLAPEMVQPLLSPVPEVQVLAEESLDLETRWPVEFVNQGFTDNILLSLHYLKGESFGRGEVNWEAVRSPFKVSFTLLPGEVFAFHENVLPQFANPAVTMNSHFVTGEGYRAVNGLGGNGVCHLASFINWAASGAGLEVVANVNHNYAPVAGVPRENGTSIRYAEIGHNAQNQNLYIENNFDYPVRFEFRVDSREVNLQIIK